MIMQVDSRIIGQDYISHTSDCGSPSSYSSYSTGSGSKLTVGASSLGSTLSTISQVTDGDSMVETELDAEERTPYSSNPTISDSLNSPCGRIRHGMGSSPPSGQQGRIFDRKRKSVFNQCEGVDSNILCSTTPRKKFKGKRDQSSHRQHDSIKVCDEVGGGTASVLLQDLAIQIQDLRSQHQLNVCYHHVAGVKNTEADILSRVKQSL